MSEAVSSEPMPEIGLCLPLTLRSAAEVGAVASEVYGEVSEYLASGGNATPTKSYSDFGYYIVSPKAMARHLEAHPEQQAMIGPFIEDINEQVRPAEPVKCSIALDGVGFSNGVNSRRVMLRIARDSKQAHQLFTRAAAVAAIAKSRFSGLKISLEKFGQVPILGYGAPGNWRAFSREEMEQTKAIINRQVNQAKLRRVEFGRLVIGAGYRQPLPGTEWP